MVVLYISLACWANNSDPYRAGWGRLSPKSFIDHREGDHTRQRCREKKGESQTGDKRKKSNTDRAGRREQGEVGGEPLGRRE